MFLDFLPLNLSGNVVSTLNWIRPVNKQFEQAVFEKFDINTTNRNECSIYYPSTFIRVVVRSFVLFWFSTKIASAFNFFQAKNKPTNQQTDRKKQLWCAALWRIKFLYLFSERNPLWFKASPIGKISQCLGKGLKEQPPNKWIVL